MATLKQVAGRAGVSISTASRVLSGSNYPVVPALRERVETAARELDYVPNAQAQGLLRGSTGMIGVLVGNVGDPYFSEMVNGIHALAVRRRLLVAICHTERDVELELEYFRMLQAHRASAVIIAGSGLSDEHYRASLAARARSFSAGGGRVVAVGNTTLDVDRVLVDNTTGAVELARHLVGLGHREIIVLAGPENVGSTLERVGGLNEIIGGAGGTLRIRYGAPTRDDAYRGAGEMFAQHPRATAVVGTADQLAIGAMTWLREHGFRVPIDVSVAGFNDISLASDLEPALTTVRLPLRRMGEDALRLALDEHAAEPRVRHLSTRLVVRASTAVASGAGAEGQGVRP
ncbi:LacI family DNA-binding transcriptional regulator [Microbacterium sp.]|uniref:LacI family DNA-binding transcriptional regulator n=1 Tax=Microbacterium sp. TaxID=51671 RepID=UPI0028126991|nr:LacI family DNA-binding transcriptional regulator [Microbacterium sp.]